MAPGVPLEVTRFATKLQIQQQFKDYLKEIMENNPGKQFKDLVQFMWYGSRSKSPEQVMQSNFNVTNLQDTDFGDGYFFFQKESNLQLAQKVGYKNDKTCSLMFGLVTIGDCIEWTEMDGSPNKEQPVSFSGKLYDSVIRNQSEYTLFNSNCFYPLYEVKFDDQNY